MYTHSFDRHNFTSLIIIYNQTLRNHHCGYAIGTHVSKSLADTTLRHQRDEGGGR